jgi:hypothetical protein
MDSTADDDLDESTREALGPYTVPVPFADDVDPVDWVLAERPGIRPERMATGWPESRRLCWFVVVRKCWEVNHDCETRAFVVARPEAMHALATSFRDRHQWWFLVPRMLFTPETCPGLTAGLWPESNVET